jgi:hypothetical protein
MRDQCCWLDQAEPTVDRGKEIAASRQEGIASLQEAQPLLDVHEIGAERAARQID